MFVFYVLSFHLSMIMFVLLGQLSVLVLAVQLTGLLVCACFTACIPSKQINDSLVD